MVNDKWERLRKLKVIMDRKRMRPVLLIVVAVMVVAVVITVAVVASGNHTNSSDGGGTQNPLAGSSWLQDSDEGFPLMGSTSKKGQSIKFLTSGDLDLGSTMGGWQIGSNGKLQYSAAGFNSLFDLAFSSNNQQLRLTGKVSGQDWAISLHRQ